MRVLLVAPVFPPYRSAAALRTYTFARVWADAGYDVTVLTTAKRANQIGQQWPTTGFRVAELPYQVPWLLERLRNTEHAAASTPNTTVLARSWKQRLLQPLRQLKARMGIFSNVRQPDLTDFWQKPALAYAQSQPRWDIVVSSGGPPAAHLVARTIKARRWAKWWAADVRDLWVDNPMYVGLFPFTLAERHRERRVLREADLITTVSEGLARRLRQKTPMPIEIIYNGYDNASFATLPPQPFFPPDGVPRLVFTGMIYKSFYDPTPALRALQRDPRWRLVVAGDHSEWWHEHVRQHGLTTRFDYLGEVSRVDSLRMQRDATALLHLDYPDPRQGVLSGKVFEYLQATAPVFVVGGAVQSPPAELLARAGRGVGCGKDTEQIAASLRALLDEPMRLNLVPNAAVLASLSREAQAARFQQLLPRDERL